jgi:hypothetical protein
VDPASSCSIRGACGRCVSPLTPDPSPLPGERGAGCGFRAKSRLYPPLPFEGRGDGGEGSKNPALRLVNASGKLRIQRPRAVSVVRVAGAFHPSPPTPLPFQGRGEPDADSGRKADSSPPLPFEGRGDGGEGSKNPARASLTLPRNCESSVFVQYPWCVWQASFTPHPDPSPSRGEGSWMRISGRKADSSPLSPSRGEGMGVRGQRTLPCAS